MRPSGAAAVPLVLGVALVALLYRWRKRRRAAATGGVPGVSIPEALHALAHAPPLKRALAARAVCGIVFGEVTVLEEVLDDAAGTHSEYGARRDDGRTLLDIALGDAGGGGADALTFLLAITERDDAWGDDDEWNAAAIKAAAVVGAAPGADVALAALAAAGGPAAEGAAALRARINGDAAPTPDTLRDSADAAAAPEPLPFNTRVHCAVCAQPAHTADGKQTHECRLCRNVTYCTAAHRDEDAVRHAFWCRGH